MKVIEKAINTLLSANPFYAHFFLNSKISYDVYGVATAAAALTTSGTQIVFNTKFINSLPPDQVCGVIEHEVLHILFEHVAAMKEDNLLNRHVANLAMDASINQWIKVLPPDCITPAMLSKATGVKMEEFQDWEYYYAKLKQQAQKLSGKSTLDDHAAAIPGQCKQGEGREALRHTVDKAMKASKGNAPEHVLKVYGDLSKSTNKLPWEQILSNFIARATASTTKCTRKKLNRRFGLDQPGKIKKRELTLGVCADSSGSVSDEAYQMFLVEIQRITKTAGVTYFVDADCQVQNVEKVKKNKALKSERHGSGGTAYQPAIDKCLQLGCDAIIYFGDMDSADTPTDPKLPFLWVVVGAGTPPGKFGSTLRLD